MTSSTPKPISVIFLMADYGHDPTETALPFQAFTSAGYTVHIATENGNSPSCDERMLSGWTQKLLVWNHHFLLCTLQFPLHTLPCRLSTFHSPLSTMISHCPSRCPKSDKSS